MVKRYLDNMRTSKSTITAEIVAFLCKNGFVLNAFKCFLTFLFVILIIPQELTWHKQHFVTEFEPSVEQKLDLTVDTSRRLPRLCRESLKMPLYTGPA